MMNIPEKHRGIPWAKEDIDSLITMYNQGFTISEMSSRIGRSDSAVSHKIKDVSIIYRLKHWNENDINSLIELRKSGKSFKSIAIILGRTERAVQGKHNRLQKNPTPIKRIVKRSKNNRRVFDVKDDYFSVIDSQKKSYYIGFLLADGYVSSNKRLNQVGLKLAEKDIDVLYDLRNELCSHMPIQMGKPRIIHFRGKKIHSTASCTINISSSRIKKDLGRFGVIENKTKICKFPSELEPEYYPGFIAGVLSGDGYIGLKYNHNSLTPNLRGAFAGTKDLINGIREVLIKEIGFNAKKTAMVHGQTEHLYVIELNKIETLKMYYWMKESGASLMPRKNNIIESFMKDYPEKCDLKVGA